MYRTWTGSASDAATVARALEAHLNEYASDVVSIAYSVEKEHYVLAVYRQLEASAEAGVEAAVAVAQHIIDETQ